MTSLILLEMPGTYGLKPWFQGRLRPLVRALANAGITANQVTVCGGVLSVGFGVFLLVSRDPRYFVFLPAVLLVRLALNAMDGMLAREFGQATRLGVYLNELADVVSDTFLYVPFAHLHGFSIFWTWVVVVLAVISEMTGSVAAMTGASRRFDGPLGKSDRAIVFSAAGLWAGLAGGLPASVAYVLPRLMAALLVLTVVNRVRRGIEEVEGENRNAAV